MSKKESIKLQVSLTYFWTPIYFYKVQKRLKANKMGELAKTYFSLQTKEPTELEIKNGLNIFVKS